MSASVWHRPTSDLVTTQTDVAIIGAGITGLSLAFWLRKLKPALKVVIIERDQVGSGASGRNAGFVTAGSTAYLAHLVRQDGVEKALAHWDIKQESLRLMREELFGHFSELEFSAEGSTTLYREQESLEQTHQLLSPFVKLQQVPVSQLQQQGLNGFVGGLQFLQEGSLHPIKLLRALQTELQQQGVTFISGQAVAWIEQHRLHLERDAVTAPKIFIALNGYAAQFQSQLGELVKPKRAQMVALEGQAAKLRGNFYDPSQRVYFRRHLDGTILVGGLRLLDEQHENSDFDKVTQVIQAGLESYAKNALGASQVLARWSGVMGFTADEKPLIKDISPGITFVGGYSGHGMGMAFGFARKAVLEFLG